MSPESWNQITLAGWLFRILAEFAEYHDLGDVAGRDFLVRLPRQSRWRAPDLVFIAKERAHLVHGTFLEGPPDIAVEIVSPDSQTRDRRDKYMEYERAGIREYWILDPVGQHAEAYALGKNKRFRRIEEADGKLASAVLPGFYLRPDWLRRPKLPPVAKVLRELGIRR